LFVSSNHLGNNMVVISDKKIGVSSNGTTIDYYNADVISAQDYYPFGQIMPGRKYQAPNSNKPRYGFNGKENDNEVKGEGNQQDYGMRIYDPRLARFLSVDPITADYAELTPYQFASNTPIQAIDLDGLEAAGVGCGCPMSQLQSSKAMELTGKTMIGVGKGFFKSLFSSIQSLATMSSPVLTPQKMQQTAAIAQAITHPKETFNSTKAGIKQWGRNLMSKDPDVAGQAFGSGLEFGFEMALPIKGMMGLKSSSMALYEGNKILSNAIKDGVQVVVAKSADDLKYLKSMGAQALYMGGEGTKGSILVAEGASRATILEEAIHHAQRLKYGDKYFYSNVAKLEVEAQNQLLKIGTKEGWKAAELSEITKAKSTWEKVLSGKK
jgi:RHS repeat-associated protein